MRCDWRKDPLATYPCSVINLDTGECLSPCAMADDETGEYERYVLDQNTGRFLLNADKMATTIKGVCRLVILRLDRKHLGLSHPDVGRSRDPLQPRESAPVPGV